MSRRLAGLVIGLAMSAACSPGSSSQGTPAQDASASAKGSAGQAAASGAAGRSASGSTDASAAAKPRFREVTLPAGTAITLELETAVSSDKSRVEDPVRARVSQPIVVDGVTVVPAGASASGVVLEAKISGRVSGRASLAMRFDRLRSGEDSYDIHTARIAREAAATKGEDAKKIGVGAGAGAIIGVIAGGKKGAAIGSVVGAGAGTGVVMATRGQEVRLGPGAKLKTTLVDPIAIAVPID